MLQKKGLPRPAKSLDNVGAEGARALGLRVVFMGTPDFAVPSLEALHRRHELVAVVTQPDRPRGRGRVPTPPPVKVAAQRLGCTVLQPERFRRRSVREQLGALGADLFVVAAFGQILSDRMLQVPPLGCVNVHASLLPRLRGAAPIQWAVLAGQALSGVSIMQMDSGIDTGPVWALRSVTLAADETAGSLHDKLAPLGAELLIETLDRIAQGSDEPKPQDESQASVAPMLRKEDGQVDFRRPCEEVSCRVRGMDPWPGAFARLSDEVVKLFGAVVCADAAGTPGRILTVDDRGMLVACAAGGVWISQLQPPGRRRMSARPTRQGTYSVRTPCSRDAWVWRRERASPRT